MSVNFFKHTEGPEAKRGETRRAKGGCNTGSQLSQEGRAGDRGFLTRGATRRVAKKLLGGRENDAVYFQSPAWTD